MDVRLGVRARRGGLLAARHRGQQRAALGGAQRGGWDIFYLVVFVAVLTVVLVSTPVSTLAASVALAALVPWYLFVGRPLWTGGRASTARATVYVVGLFVLFGVAQSQNPEVWFVAFAIAPQFFSFLDARLAVGLGITLNFLAAAPLVYRYPDAAATAFAIAATGGGFSVFYNAWVSRIIRHLDLAARTARENLAEVRVLVADLAPAQLDGGTLPDALRRLSQAPGVDASFGLSGTPRSLPMATEVVLLRVRQEALANVRKHACAQSTTVRLDYDRDAVRLEVSDDGTGFDPDRVNGGYGLRGMRTRVAEAGGTLTVRSSPGAGTRVDATVSA